MIPKKKPRVLIVEDTRESVELLTYFLKPAGYEVTSAGDGQQALESIKEKIPDIILLDVMLPKLNGYKLCEHLKKNSQTFHVPIIMITALKELKHKIQALEAGADDFISKPFDSIELLTRVKSLLRIKFFHDELIRRNRELERQKRILQKEDELKKELTGLIVHDMKNPLFVIQGNLQMMHMLKEAGQPADGEKYAERIERSSRGLLRMILNLLDISRLEQNMMELEPVPVNLSQMLHECVDCFVDQQPHSNKKIEWSLFEDLPAAFVDKNIMERVFDNLFNYVFENTPQFSEIRAASQIEKSGMLTLIIFHEGKPIPTEFCQKIFAKYSQPELKKAGFKPARGLGLIFCHMAINASGGSITVQPVGTRGNEFTIHLPIWEAHTASSNSPQAPASPDINN